VKTLYKFIGRHPAEQWMLVKALVVVTAVRIALTTVPYRRVEAWSARRPGQESDATLSPRHARTLWAVGAVSSRLLGKRPCLVQAIAARWMLGRQGLDTDLRIGVARKAGELLLAHAWLERDGRVLIGGAASPVRFEMLKPVRRGQEHPRQRGLDGSASPAHDRPDRETRGTQRAAGTA
jgi:hypothetical protein